MNKITKLEFHKHPEIMMEGITPVDVKISDKVDEIIEVLNSHNQEKEEEDIYKGSPFIYKDESTPKVYSPSTLTGALKREEVKGWFEANYLDGDKIQKGQMLSSEECFDAILSSHKRVLQALLEEIERMKKRANDLSNPMTLEIDVTYKEERAYNQALDDIKSLIKNICTK